MKGKVSGPSAALRHLQLESCWTAAKKSPGEPGLVLRSKLLPYLPLLEEALEAPPFLAAPFEALFEEAFEALLFFAEEEDFFAEDPPFLAALLEELFEELFEAPLDELLPAAFFAVAMLFEF